MHGNIEVHLIALPLFRWKGENVSTQEVEGTISSVLEMVEVSVYGVLVPNSDGRAGMAAIRVQGKEGREEDLLRDLWSGLKDRLPVYARPVFVRFAQHVDITGKAHLFPHFE